MQRIDGKLVAAHHEGLIKARVEAFKKKTGKSPGLAVILVGDDPASRIYVRNKEAACERVGIVSSRYDVDKKSNVEELESLLNRLNADQDVHGVLVQIPLPLPFKFGFPPVRAWRVTTGKKMEMLVVLPLFIGLTVWLCSKNYKQLADLVQHKLVK